MTHGCSCCQHRGTAEGELLATGNPPPAIDAGESAGEVARRSPRALAVLADLGLDHCCGGHLSLAEAAAAAGVPVDAVIEAVARALAEPAAAP
jgi:regulator of cell morphogenesis and NO signaling